MRPVPVVDQDCCIGCEVCTQICPEVFRMEGDDEAGGHDHHDHKSIVHDPYGAQEDKIEEAMDACPAACIHWQD
ncbi:MAG: ferredoxin [Desulfuromonas sp.]|nr:MAG: ferredoxin [Desulfuromonas sp.]